MSPQQRCPTRYPPAPIAGSFPDPRAVRRLRGGSRDDLLFIRWKGSSQPTTLGSSAGRCTRPRHGYLLAVCELVSVGIIGGSGKTFTAKRGVAQLGYSPSRGVPLPQQGKHACRGLVGLSQD